MTVFLYALKLPISLGVWNSGNGFSQEGWLGKLKVSLTNQKHKNEMFSLLKFMILFISTGNDTGNSATLQVFSTASLGWQA